MKLPWKAPASGKVNPVQPRTLHCSSNWQTVPVVTKKRPIMIEQTLRRFCESKHRKLIVTGITFVVGLLLVMPLVDSIRAGGDEKDTSLTELDSARNIASELNAFERRVNEKLAQLKSMDGRTVDDSSLPKLRSQLIDFAKNTCSI